MEIQAPSCFTSDDLLILVLLKLFFGLHQAVVLVLELLVVLGNVELVHAGPLNGRLLKAEKQKPSADHSHGCMRAQRERERVCVCVCVCV